MLKNHNGNSIEENLTLHFSASSLWARNMPIFSEWMILTVFRWKWRKSGTICLNYRCITMAQISDSILFFSSPDPAGEIHGKTAIESKILFFGRAVEEIKFCFPFFPAPEISLYEKGVFRDIFPNGKGESRKGGKGKACLKPCRSKKIFFLFKSLFLP